MKINAIGFDNTDNNQDDTSYYSSVPLKNILEGFNFKVSRLAQTTSLSIMIDDKMAELPEGFSVELDKVYVDVIVDLMKAKGYSQLSIQSALNFHPTLEDHERVIWEPHFKELFSQIMRGVEFLPVTLEKAFEEGRLRSIWMGEENPGIPYALQATFSGMDIKSIPIYEVTKEKVEMLVDPIEGKPVPNELTGCEFLATHSSHVRKLKQLGLKVWTVDEIVRNKFISGANPTIKDLQACIRNSKINDDNSLTVRVAGTEIKVECVDDPDPIKAENSNQKVWFLKSGNMEKRLSKWHFVEDPEAPQTAAIRGTMVDPSKIILTWLYFLRMSSNEQDVTGKLALSNTNAWIREIFDYGVNDNSYRLMSYNTVNVCKIRAARNRLAPVVENGKNLGDAARALYLLGEPAITDAQVKTLYAGDGARMRFFDIKVAGTDPWGKPIIVVRNANDSSKPNKLVNRGGLCSQQQADVSKFGTWTLYNQVNASEDPIAGGPSLLVDSGMRISGVNRQGIKLKTMISNWRFANGSGVATAHPKLELLLRINKQERFHQAAIYPQGKTVEEYFQENFRSLDINHKVEPGDTILWFKGIPTASFGKSDKGMIGYINGAPKARASNLEYEGKGRKTVKSFDLSGTIGLSVMYFEKAAKLRAPGVKATLYCEEITIKDNDGNLISQPDVILSNEEIKQDLNKIACLQMFADTVDGGLDYDISNGLTDDQKTRFDDWYNSTIKHAWFSTKSMNPEIYDGLKSRLKDEEGILWDDDNRIITQWVTYLEGDMVLSVEVSTVRENMGVQALIGEQLAALSTISHDLALDLWNANGDAREAVEGMLDMVSEKPTKAIWEFGAMTNPKIVYDHRVLEEKGTKTVFWGLHKQFPEGLTIKVAKGGGKGINQVCLKFDALAKFTTAADRIGSMTLRILDLITEVQPMKGFETILSRYIGMLKGAFGAWISAPGILKGLTRTDKILFARKVKTHARDCIKFDEIGVNPKDPLVKSGKLTDGDFLVVSRSPMISVVGLTVKITESAPIGTFLVNAYVWHMGNEGDGDGDGIAALKVTDKKLIDKINKALQTSVFGPKGYDVAWSGQHPYFDFHDAKNILENERTGETEYDYNEVVNILQQIKDHYTIFVGKTFAMASALTFRVEYENTMRLIAKNMPNENPEVVEFVNNLKPGVDTVCAKVWRRFYEGLALSGISDVALFVAKEIGRLGTANMVTILDSDTLPKGKNQVPIFEILQGMGYKVSELKRKSEDNSYEYINFTGVAGMEVICKLANIPMDKEELDALYWAVVVTSIYSRIEKANFTDSPNFDMAWEAFVKELPKHMQNGRILDDAKLFGGLRRAGAGQEDSRHEDGTALPSLVTMEMIFTLYPEYSITGAIAQAAIPQLKTVSTLLRKKLQSDAASPQAYFESLTGESGGTLADRIQEALNNNQE